MANRPNPHAGYSFYSNEEQQYAYFDHDAHAPSGGFAAELGDAQPQTLLGYSGPHHALLPQSQSQLHVSHHTLAADASNKHRRSRSGCLTCRSRRVKCDELRPICERCHKGNRECLYPQPNVISRPGDHRTKGKPINAQINEDPEEEQNSRETSHGLDSELPRVTKSESPSSSTTSARASLSRSSLVNLSTGNNASPSKAPGQLSDLEASASPDEHDLKWDQITKTRRFLSLDRDIQWYLNYHRSHITHHHYHLAHGSSDFVTYYIVEQCLTSDSLLYAVLSFTAYHHAVASPDGKSIDFLRYYGQALNYLGKVIANRKKMRTQTLLTILQLASLEEHFGDWVTLLHHQKAGYKILTEIYTLELVKSDPLVNKTLEWYIRFDLHAGFMAGRRTVLSQYWFEAHWEGYLRQLNEKPGDIGIKCDERLALNRLLGTKLTVLFANHGKGILNEPDFTREAEHLRGQFKAWTKDVDPEVVVPAVASISTPGSLDEMLMAADLHLSRGDEIGPLQYALLNFWSLELMFDLQMATAQRKPPGPDTLILVSKMLAVVGIVMRGDTTPGALLNVQGSLSMASLFVHDAPTIQWARKALAQIECLGYIYPSAFRKRVTDAWQTVDATEWWYPNGEGQTPFLKAIQEFTRARDTYRATAPTDRVNDDGFSDDIKEMTGIFNTLELALSPTSSHNSDSNSTPERGANP